MFCQLFGHLTDEIGSFKNLQVLDLWNNSIYGPIPPYLWEVTSLKSLDLSRNKLDATISQIQLSNLTSLIYIRLDKNSRIELKLDPDWIAPFQLVALDLGSCNLGPHFPLWIRSQKSLYLLDISNNGISDIIPDWFWKLSHLTSDPTISLVPYLSRPVGFFQ